MNRLMKAIEMEREIAGHLFARPPEPQVLQEWREACGYTDKLLAGLAGHDGDPMSPDYAALSRHEPTSQTADSRAAAGLHGGDPFTPTITTLPHRAHGHAEGCDCKQCAMIRDAYERVDVLHQETY